MKWTTEIPTKPGWYWIKDDFFSPKPSIVEIYQKRKFLRALFHGPIPFNPLSEIGEVPVCRISNACWAGPIETPL